MSIPASSSMDANLVRGNQTHGPHHVTSLISWRFARAILNSLNGSTQCWAYIQCTETRTHWLSSQQAHSPSTCNDTLIVQLSVSVCIERLSLNLAGDRSGPNSFFHDLVVCFDRVVGGQKIILVSHLHIVSMVTAFHCICLKTDVEILQKRKNRKKKNKTNTKKETRKKQKKQK